MKILLNKLIIFSFAVSVYGTTLAADCMLEEHAAGGGYQLSMSNGAAYSDFSNVMISSRHWVGYLLGFFTGGWHGEDISFDKAASRATVIPGCVLYLYERVNFTGKTIEIANALGNSGNFTQNLHEIGFGDVSSSAHCNCTNVFTPYQAR